MGKRLALKSVTILKYSDFFFNLISYNFMMNDIRINGNKPHQDLLFCYQDLW